MSRSRKIILLSLCGKSPAVITETIYAFAKDNPQLIPDEVIAVGTSECPSLIKAELLDSGIWKRLKILLGVPKTKLLFGEAADCVRLIPSAAKSGNADDITSSSDSEMFSGFIMNTLRQFTENPDAMVIFSIAGGRKSMSSVSALAMSLLGRNHDRLCHVLVTPPFDNPGLRPRFYFPDCGIREYKTPDGKSFSADKAEITLCDIPFVRLRYLFQKQYLRLPGNYLDTVEFANSMIHPDSAEMPELVLHPDSLNCEIGGIKVSLTPAEFAVYWLLAARRKNDLPPLRGQKAMLEDFQAFSKSISSSIMPEVIHHNHFQGKSDDDMRKLVSSISKKIKQAVGLGKSIAFCLPSKGHGAYGISLSPEKIFCPRNY